MLIHLSVEHYHITARDPTCLHPDSGTHLAFVRQLHSGSKTPSIERAVIQDIIVRRANALKPHWNAGASRSCE